MSLEEKHVCRMYKRWGTWVRWSIKYGNVALQRMFKERGRQ